MRGKNLHYDISKALVSNYRTGPRVQICGKSPVQRYWSYKRHLCTYVPSFLVQYQSLVAAEDYSDLISDRRLYSDRPDPIAESTAVALYVNCCVWCSYNYTVAQLYYPNYGNSVFYIAV